MNLQCLIICVTVLFTWVPVTMAATGGSRFSISSDRVIGFVLRGNTVSEIEVVNQVDCRSRCAEVVNCKSVNLFANAEGKFVCQLNNATKGESAAAQFVRNTGGDSFELKAVHLNI